MTEDDLIQAARDARRSAYAPYSGFLVGAAVLTSDGRLFSGCNVENAAYPEGVCAEAGALCAMVLGGARKVRMIAISAGSEGPAQPCLPCGGCRQKILEFAAQDAEVLTDGPGGARRYAFSALLPDAFGPQDLTPTA
jgi:cytidine deaminase